VPHHVVVHSEDRAAFEAFARDGVRLLSTAELLPQAIEIRRRQAQRWAQRLGPRLRKWCASLHKRTGRPDWVRYGGWQTQQLSKLAFAAAQPLAAVVVLDSDLLITRPFDLQLFTPGGRVALFEHAQPTPGPWHAGACRLLKQPLTGPFNGYVGTPFVLHPPTVRALLAWLEQTYGAPWPDVLLSQPVSSWSEFCLYNLFARMHDGSGALKVTANPHSQDLYSEDLAQDAASAGRTIQQRFDDPQVYFTNIPSQRLARGKWQIGAFEALLHRQLGAAEGGPAP
jgi:hypothetical protein